MRYAHALKVVFSTCALLLSIEEVRKMSADLQWLIIRNNSSFLVRRRAPRKGGITLTKEPNNLVNRNSFKFNGLVNRKAVGVTPASEDKGLVLNTKITRKGRTPANMFVKIPLGQERRRAFRSIRKHLGGTNYRQDLIKYAVLRASALSASLRPVKRLRKQKRKH